MVPILFQHSLKDYEEDTVANLDHIFGVQPMKITSPSTDAEVSLALRVLEGCCLLHRESTVLAHQYKAIKVLMNILSFRGELEQGACLDALISMMLDSSANQVDFEACNGIEEVAEIIRDKQVDENLRFYVYFFYRPFLSLSLSLLLGELLFTDTSTWLVLLPFLSKLIFGAAHISFSLQNYGARLHEFDCRD